MHARVLCLLCACAPLALTSLKEMAPLASVSICLNSSFSAFGSIGIDNAPSARRNSKGVTLASMS